MLSINFIESVTAVTNYRVMRFLLGKCVLAGIIMASLMACSDTGGRSADPAAVKAALMQIMDDALSGIDTLDPYGFAIDEQSVQRRKDLDTALLKRLDEIDPSLLDERDKLFYEMIRWDLVINLEGYELPQFQMPLDQFNNPVAVMAEEVGATPPDSKTTSRAAAGYHDISEHSAAWSAAGSARWRQDIDHRQGGVASGATTHGWRQGVVRSQTKSAARSPALTDDPLAWYREHLVWLKAYNTFLTEVKHQFEAGSAQGNTLPDEVLDLLLIQLDGQLNGSAIRGSYNGWQQLPADADECLRSEYKGILDSINSRYLVLRNYLDYRNGGGYAVRIGSDKCDDGYCGMTNGKDLYRWLLKKNTTTQKTPEEIHAVGLAEVDSIFAKMVQVCYAVGTCDNQDVANAKQSGQIYVFFRYLNQPGFFYQNPVGLWSTTLNPDTAAGAVLSESQNLALAEHQRALDDYNAYKLKIALILPDFFDSGRTIPALGYDVAAVPYSDAFFVGSALYQPGDVKTGEKGLFFLNTYLPYSMQTWGISTLLAHEGDPGHHFQDSVAQQIAAKDPSFPDYAARADYTAFCEGWGLYAEYLAEHDMKIYGGRGLYDPTVGDTKVVGSPAFNNQLQYFGRLNNEMLRAMRLVVDTGIHWYGWSHERAVAYMNENSALPMGNIISEVRRYMALAGQATSYKIGELALVDMRESAEQSLGKAFDLKAFHHHLLEDGMLPLSVLEQKNAQWIRELNKKK